MNAKTLEVLEALKADTDSLIVPCVYTYSFPASNVSAAFKIAKEQGLLTIAHYSRGRPVYRKAA